MNIPVKIVPCGGCAVYWSVSKGELKNGEPSITLLKSVVGELMIES